METKEQPKTYKTTPKSDTQHVVVSFKLKCEITKDMLHAMGCVNIPHEVELLEALNKYCKQYEINTCLRVAHFLSQAAHESGCFKNFSEGTKYAESIAIGCSSYVAYRHTPEGKALKLTPRKNEKGEIVDYDCKQPEYFNCKYANNQGNGNFASGDGFKYRGSGLIQITFRNTYKNFTTRYNQKNPDDIKDFEANPELIRTKVKYAVASACDYWRNKEPVNGKRLNQYADEGSSDEVVLKIGAVINGWNGKNTSVYNNFSDAEKTHWKKIEDNLYLKKPKGYDDRLNKFHKLKKYMKL